MMEAKSEALGQRMGRPWATDAHELRLAVLAPFGRGDGGPDRQALATGSQLVADIARAHRTYQLADYDRAARILVPLLHRIDVTTAPPAVRAVAYLASAKLVSKLGDDRLARVVADRCAREARRR